MRRLLSLFIGEETEAQELNNLPVISNLVGALAFEPMWFDLKPVASAFFSALAAEFLPHLPQLAKVLIPQIGVIITWRNDLAKVKVAQSCLTLSNTMDCSLPGSSVHRIL